MYKSLLHFLFADKRPVASFCFCQQKLWFCRLWSTSPTSSSQSTPENKLNQWFTPLKALPQPGTANILRNAAGRCEVLASLVKIKCVLLCSVIFSVQAQVSTWNFGCQKVPRMAAKKLWLPTITMKHYLPVMVVVSWLSFLVHCVGDREDWPWRSSFLGVQWSFWAIIPAGFPFQANVAQKLLLSG